MNYISSFLGEEIIPRTIPFESLYAMAEWFTVNIKNRFPDSSGYFKRIEAAFVQANDDGIFRLSMSFSPPEDMGMFVKAISDLHKTYAPNTAFSPELSFDRACDTDYIYSLLDEMFSYNYFKSVDISCNEFAQPIKNFKRIFQLAQSHGLTLKAHAGEFGTAEDVMEAVEELELQEVHHGIAAAESAQIMKWLANHKIQLNLCPASNIMLGLVENYAVHPIKKLYDAGIPVTINTDDLIVFNQSISQEYLNLFHANLFNAYDLDKIREIGLNIF